MNKENKSLKQNKIWKAIDKRKEKKIELLVSKNWVSKIKKKI